MKLINYKNFNVLLLSLICTTVHAQFKLSGKVIDQENKIIPFVTVKISGTQNLVDYTQTDSLGTYQFKLPSGKYSAAFSAINFESVNRLVTITGNTVINVQLHRAPAILADVQVSAKKALIEKKSKGLFLM